MFSFIFCQVDSHVLLNGLTDLIQCFLNGICIFGRNQQLAAAVHGIGDAVKGECVGAPEHTGMIVGKKGDTLMVLEGNYDNQVKIREICVEYVKVRGYCKPDYASLVQPFVDVPGDHIHADGIAWGAEKGIVFGVGGGKFEPDRPVTRGELMTILHRLSK